LKSRVSSLSLITASAEPLANDHFKFPSASELQIVTTLVSKSRDIVNHLRGVGQPGDVQASSRVFLNKDDVIPSVSITERIRKGIGNPCIKVLSPHDSSCTA
jgi:hypothetical protein